MAPIGGGPPIGSTGGTFTGPAEALEIYGDFAAAYTGLQASNTTKFTVLSFTTGNYLFVGEFQLNGAVGEDDPTDIQKTSATIKLNGAGVSLITSGQGDVDALMSQTQALLIPAYTQVTVEFDMANTTSAVASGSLIGRIYR
tara:strand:+ start:139 stop:564 length:426 start_codon:yes stop_codon:yes gene_type:complete